MQTDPNPHKPDPVPPEDPQDDAPKGPPVHTEDGGSGDPSPPPKH